MMPLLFVSSENYPTFASTMKISEGQRTTIRGLFILLLVILLVIALVGVYRGDMDWKYFLCIAVPLVLLFVVVTLSVLYGRMGDE